MFACAESTCCAAHPKNAATIAAKLGATRDDQHGSCRPGRGLTLPHVENNATRRLPARGLGPSA